MGKRVKAKLGDTILHSALRSGIGIRSECGGILGRCGKCRVIVKDQSKLNLPTKVEKEFLKESELEEGYRLACQSIVQGEVRVFIPEESRVRKRKIQLTSIQRTIELKPAVRKLHIKLSPPTLTDTRSDAERLVSTLREVYGICELSFSFNALKELPKVAREADWDLTVTLIDDKEIVSIEPRDTTNLLYGVAIDLGTSKIVASLIDLRNGNVVISSGIENPQTIYGEDVISRITHATLDEKRREELKLLVIEGLNSILADLCETINVNDLYEMVIVGNTAMHHLLLGLDTKYLAMSPYVPVVSDSLNLHAKDLGINMNRCGRIYLPPVIAGFVGSDNVADLLSTNLHEIEDLSLLIDLGTNTEIDLGDRDEILCCSCASGPAWEGGHIKHGVKAMEGAIERVSIDPQTYDAHYETIGGFKPVGICGSGMIDLLAEMLKCGLIDSRGRYRGEISTPRLRKGDLGYEYVVAWADETDIGEDIVITQTDIAELQLAKAATYCGCRILMKRKAVEAKDIKKVFIAGTFGSYIDFDNAKIIGLIPDVPIERIEFVGNAALSGAEMLLKSRELRKNLKNILQKVRYIELGVQEDFNDEFISALPFPHSKKELFPSVINIIRG
ncbi:MAG: ASKHA domain-containing protein [Nitrososphaerales archaeon]|nr:ASKHA domain-containing protein [Nitrososphaerales archaeon]